MLAQIKSGWVILIPQTDDHRELLALWKEESAGHVFHAHDNGRGLALCDLGPKADACREPINVTSRSTDPAHRLISNFAATPFELDGQSYRSVESFWQGLKFAGTERRRVAEMEGPAAWHVGEKQGYGPTVRYHDREVVVGTRDHWDLMAAACSAKFEQNADARVALLATNDRPLTHRTRRDSKAIPGVIMADIWMRVRARLRDAPETEDDA